MSLNAVYAGFQGMMKGLMMKKRWYLIAYDIHCPKRLYRMRRLLEEYAIRRQKSVFESYLSRQEKESLLKQAQAILHESEDQFLITPIPSSLQAKQFPFLYLS